MIVSPILAKTIPIPKYSPVSPVTCVIFPFIGVNVQKCFLSANICELDPPSKCASTSISFTITSFVGYRRSHSCFNLNELILFISP